MTSNYSKIVVDPEEIVYRNERSHSLYLGFLPNHIRLTSYYVVEETFR